jgi:hypothetical protein
MDTQEILKTQQDGDGMDIGQKVMIGVVALVILIGGYFVFKPAGDEPAVVPGDQQLSPAVAPVVDGDKTYTLESLVWVFEPQGADENGAPNTRVRLQLKGFKRNDVPIDVALYRLGTYRGECQSSAPVAGEPVPPTPHALAMAQCWWDTGGRQLGVYQEGNALVVKVRSVTSDSAELAPAVPILTIDLTKVVQPAL